MTEEIQKMAPIIRKKIEGSERILMHLHPAPDLDSIGSTLAMKRVLKQWEKDVTIISGDSPLPNAFSTLPGADDITDARFHDIDLSAFDLFLILDTGAEEQITRNDPPTFPITIPSVAIDHHRSNASFADVSLVVESYPATAQVLFDLFSLWEIEIDHDIAINLFLGIYSDTSGFKYRNPTHRTFQIAATLADIAPDFYRYLYITENMRAPQELYLLGLAFSNITTCCDGAVAYVALSNEALQKHEITKEHTELNVIAGALKGVVGWDLTFSAIEEEPNVIKLSFRSRDPERFDVSVAAKELGGGGHASSAAAVMRIPLDAAVEKARTVLEALYRKNKEPNS